MTLVVALRARDGVVIAADGQATTDDPLVPTKSESEEKLHILHGRVAYGCAGSVGLEQRVAEALQREISPEDCALPISALRPKLHAAVNAIQCAGKDEYVDLGREGDLPAHLEVLFCGVDPNEPWIYEIGVLGWDQLHPKGEAIGHATHFPYYLMVSTIHYELHERGVAQAKLLVYRAVHDAILTDARLGEPISLVTVTSEGVRRIDDDGLAAVRDSINGWKEQEHSIFRGLDDGIPMRAPATEVPGLSPSLVETYLPPK